MVLTSLTGLAVTAQDASAKPKASAKETPSAQETTALKFAKQHHAELLALLEPLKTSSPKEYQKGIRELSRAAERIALIKDDQRQKLEIEAWKANSQIRLLGARLSMEHSSEIETQLKSALHHQREVRIELAEHELKQVQQRQTRLTTELERLRTDPQSQIDREYDQLLKRLTQQSVAVNKKMTDKKQEKATKSKASAKTAADKSQADKPANPKTKPNDAKSESTSR